MDLVLTNLVATAFGVASVEAAKQLGKAAIAKGTDLIKSCFAKEGPGAEKALAVLEAAPDSHVAQAAVKGRLELLMAEDSVFADEIKALFASVRINAPVNQSARTHGDESPIVQVVGDNNTVR